MVSPLSFERRVGTAGELPMTAGKRRLRRDELTSLLDESRADRDLEDLAALQLLVDGEVGRLRVPPLHLDLLVERPHDPLRGGAVPAEGFPEHRHQIHVGAMTPSRTYWSISMGEA